jgi:hypothetical protein
MSKTVLELKTVAIRPHGVYSVLKWNDEPFAVSVEISPPVLVDGIYRCHRDFYHKGGYPTFEIEVDGHDRILFHKGNFGNQSKACVIIAESFAVLDGKIAVADYARGFQEFMHLTAEVNKFEMLVSAEGTGTNRRTK